MMWVEMLKKSDAFEAFKKFKNLLEKEKNEKIYFLRTYQGGEFNSDEFTKFYIFEGIKR